MRTFQAVAKVPRELRGQVNFRSDARDQLLIRRSYAIRLSHMKLPFLWVRNGNFSGSSLAP